MMQIRWWRGWPIYLPYDYHDDTFTSTQQDFTTITYQLTNIRHQGFLHTSLWSRWPYAPSACCCKNLTSLVMRWNGSLTSFLISNNGEYFLHIDDLVIGCHWNHLFAGVLHWWCCSHCSFSLCSASHAKKLPSILWLTSRCLSKALL